MERTWTVRTPGAIRRCWSPFATARRTENVDGALLLIEAGADVNVATAAIGWTPLHLAADLNRPEVAEALLRRGARVNARTHLGGWTPLLVAERRRGGGNEVAAVLRQAGGVATKRERATLFPVYTAGRFITGYPPPSAQEIQDALYATPRFGLSGGGRAVDGSFTVADADERLVFEGIGIPERAYGSYYTLVALVSEDGLSRPVLAKDLYIDFKGLCRDPVTGAHTAVFQRAYDGSCCPEEHMVYMHYRASERTLVESFVDDDLAGSSAWPKGVGGECPWREKTIAARSGRLSAPTPRQPVSPGDESRECHPLHRSRSRTRPAFGKQRGGGICR